MEQHSSDTPLRRTWDLPLLPEPRHGNIVALRVKMLEAAKECLSNLSPLAIVEAYPGAASERFLALGDEIVHLSRKILLEWLTGFADQYPREAVAAFEDTIKASCVSNAQAVMEKTRADFRQATRGASGRIVGAVLFAPIVGKSRLNELDMHFNRDIDAFWKGKAKEPPQATSGEFETLQLREKALREVARTLGMRRYSVAGIARLIGEDSSDLNNWKLKGENAWPTKRGPSDKLARIEGKIRVAFDGQSGIR